MALGNCAVVHLQPQDDFASVQHRLSWLAPGRAVLVLPWDLLFLSRDVDFQLVRREAQRHRLEIAIAAADPERRALARRNGMPAFSSAEDAQEAPIWHAHVPRPARRPGTPWYQEPTDLRPRRVRPRWPLMRWLGLAARYLVFLLAVAVIAASAYLVVPSAEVTLLPSGEDFGTIVTVSADPEIETVDLEARVIPARRVGIEVEGNAEVGTTGLRDVALGRTKGEVLFTNLLQQDYVVPAGTVLRTSSTSYPTRFRTTADVTVPAGSQALAPIESVDERVGNVGAYQINQIEGSAASALRAINPQQTAGSVAEEVHVVTQADYDRAHQQLVRQLLDQAHAELSNLDLLLPTEFVPRQSLRIEAVPKETYTRFVGEQADTVGLELRLLVSGLAVDADNAELVAYRALGQRLPGGYSLVDASFEVGEVAEEDIGPGSVTFFVTAHGYAAAEVSREKALALVRGKLVGAARQQLVAELPLAQEPQITIWPEGFRRLPLLALRVTVRIVRQNQPAGRPQAAH